MRRFGVQNTVPVHRALDTVALRDFADGQMGILHVDGSHSAELSHRSIEQRGSRLAACGDLFMDHINWLAQVPMVTLMESLLEPVPKQTRWAICRRPAITNASKVQLAR